MSRVPTRLLRPPLARRGLLVLLTVGAAALVGCSSPTTGQLLVADAPDPGAQDPDAPTDIAIWAVDPGDEIGDDDLLTERAISPIEVSTQTEDGLTWVNSLGREWGGGTLLAFGDGEQSLVTAGDPGEDQEIIGTSPEGSQPVRTTVLRRGAYVQTAEGCVLATDAESVETVGEGSCAISSDERWVASWSATGDVGLTIRDLRSGDDVTVDDLAVVNVAVLSADARVLAVVTDGQQYRGVVLDAADGSEIGRTDPYDFLDVAAIGTDAEGFVVQAASDAGTELLFVDTDAEVESIDQGFYLIPIVNGSHVTYLSYDQDLTQSSLRTWSPGHEAEVLLEGYVGAGRTDTEHVVATLETTDGTEIWRQEHSTGEMTKVLTVPLGDGVPADGTTSAGVAVSTLWVKGDTAHLQVDADTGSSYVRVDLIGDDSDAPVENVLGLSLVSLDADGTALLSRPRDAASADAQDGSGGATELMSIRAHDHDPEVRTTVEGLSTSLIHEGTIYFTDVSDPSRTMIRSVRASGSDTDVTDLYERRQIAGATWPEQGGAVQEFMITPRLVIEQQQRAAQQQQQAATGVQP